MDMQRQPGFVLTTSHAHPFTGPHRTGADPKRLGKGWSPFAHNRQTLTPSPDRATKTLADRCPASHLGPGDPVFRPREPDRTESSPAVGHGE